MRALRPCSTKAIAFMLLGLVAACGGESGSSGAGGGGGMLPDGGAGGGAGGGTGVGGGAGGGGGGPSGPATLLLDLAPDPGDPAAFVNPRRLTVAGGITYFMGTDPLNGMELWRSDGTAAGTYLVDDILPGPISIYVADMVGVGSTLFFSVDDGIHGPELWRSDGTPEGTFLAADIAPGGSGSAPTRLTAVGARLFFSALDPDLGQQALFVSDGTPEGTLALDVVNPDHLVAVGDTLYCIGTRGAVDGQLVMSDGTPAGTQSIAVPFDDASGAFARLRVTDLAAHDGKVYFMGRRVDGSAVPDAAGSGLFVSDGAPDGSGTSLLGTYQFLGAEGGVAWASAGSTLYFAAESTANGAELWKSTSGGAPTLVQEIAPGAAGASPSDFAVLGTSLYFVASETASATDRDLYRADGGTLARVVDFADGALPRGLLTLGTGVVFRATDDAGEELWRTDGTEAGTARVADIDPGASDALIADMVVVDDHVLFSARSFEAGIELFRSDGTEAGTKIVRDAVAHRSASPHGFVEMNGALYFAASDASIGVMTNHELWKTDGTVPGTMRVADIRPGTLGSDPTELTVIGDTLYFAASDDTHGLEPFVSDGTTAGTRLLKDMTNLLTPGPRDFVEVGDTVYFVATDDAGEELWKTDGTEAGTVMVKDIEAGGGSSAPADLMGFGGVLVFTAEDSSGGRELWKSDGTEAGTVPIADIEAGAGGSDPASLVVLGDALYFTATTAVSGRELYVTDGTDVGTSMVDDIHATAGTGSDPDGLTVFDGALVFAATDETTGRELYRTDGVTTELVLDIRAGVLGSNPGNLLASGTFVYFTAHDGSGVKLFRSDGTMGGTQIVSDAAAPEAPLLGTAAFALTGDVLLFSADDATHGIELWASDGTALGTTILEDAWADEYSGFRALVGAPIAGTPVLFAAADGVHGVELHRTDGTPGGTRLLQEFAPGPGSSAVQEVVEIDGTLLVVVDDGVHGAELWSIPVAEL